jgi:hypothetical protein
VRNRGHPSRWQRLLDAATTESGIRRKALETYPAMVWLCKLHWLGLAAPRPGADSQLDHILAWLEEQTGTARPTIGTVVLGRVEGGPGPATRGVGGHRGQARGPDQDGRFSRLDPGPLSFPTSTERRLPMKRHKKFITLKLTEAG